MAKESDSKKIDYIQDRVDSVASTVSNIDKEMALQKASFDAHLKQDEKMYDEFKRMNDILQQNTDSLKEHMHRSDLLEDIQTQMRAECGPVHAEFVRKAAVRDWVMGKIKFTGKLGAAVTAIAGLWLFVEPWLKHLIK